MKQLSMALALCIAGLFTPAHALLVAYTGDNGLSATADFTLENGGNQLRILLTNTSNPAAALNGSADQVLSSLNFNLGTANITGGTALLPAGSNVVRSTNTSAWEIVNAGFDLDEEFGFSNTGVGNSGGLLDEDEECADALNAITSHTGGGNRVTNFNGDVGGVGNGLNFGLVADGTNDIGNNREFIQNSIVLLLDLDTALNNLAFLSQCSYVEFGSDFLYVPNDFDPNNPDEPVIPEPTSLGLVGLGLVGLLRRRKLARG